MRIIVLQSEVFMVTIHPQTRAAPARDAGIDVAAALAAWVSGVEPSALFCGTRGEAEVSAARQLAIYLAHVALGHDLSRLSSVFGRDRATLRHALRRIEDWRDDPGFDRRLSQLEAILMPLRGARMSPGADR